MLELTGWHTIAEIEAACDMPYETIRQVVKRASANEETWVKMGVYPRRWLIDTGSEPFARLVEMWTVPFQDESEFSDTGALHPLPVVPLPFVAQHGALSGSHQSLPLPFVGSGAASSWPELCQWLRNEGALIFANVLENGEDAFWQWQWGELAGDGYESVEAAILGAIQTKILYAKREIACLQNEKDARTPWFRRA